MKPSMFAAALLLAARLARAQTSGPEAYAAELTGLQNDYQKQMSAFYASLKDAKDDEFQKAYADPVRNPTKSFTTRALDLARKASGTPVAVKAKVYALQIGSSDSTTRDAVIADLFDHHIDSPEMETAAQILARPYNPAEKSEAAKRLQLLEQKSPHAVVRAAAVAGQLEQVYDSYMGSGDTTTARKLAKRLVSDYGSTRYGKRAAGLLFQMDNLSIGKPAPDIQGEDQEGVRFKLSDYRGKVVVLDFWGFW